MVSSHDVMLLCCCTSSLQTSLVFSVGEEEVQNFRMVERHYFRDQVRHTMQTAVVVPKVSNISKLQNNLPAIMLSVSSSWRARSRDAALAGAVSRIDETARK